MIRKIKLVYAIRVQWEKCERRILTVVNYFKWMLVHFFMEEKFVKRQNNMGKTIEINFQEDIQEITSRQEPAFISSGWSMKLFPCVSYSSNYALISLDTTGLHAYRCYKFVVPFPFLVLATVITSYSSIHNSLLLSEAGMLSDPQTHFYRNKLFLYTFSSRLGLRLREFSKLEEKFTPHYCMWNVYSWTSRWFQLFKEISRLSAKRYRIKWK